MPKGKLLDESNANKNPPPYLKETLLTIAKIADVLTDIIKENVVQSPDIETEIEITTLNTLHVKKLLIFPLLII